MHNLRTHMCRVKKEILRCCTFDFYYYIVMPFFSRPFVHIYIYKPFYLFVIAVFFFEDTSIKRHKKKLERKRMCVLRSCNVLLFSVNFDLIFMDAGGSNVFFFRPVARAICNCHQPASGTHIKGINLLKLRTNWRKKVFNFNLAKSYCVFHWYLQNLLTWEDYFFQDK